MPERHYQGAKDVYELERLWGTLPLVPGTENFKNDLIWRIEKRSNSPIVAAQVEEDIVNYKRGQFDGLDSISRLMRHSVEDHFAMVDYFEIPLVSQENLLVGQNLLRAWREEVGKNSYGKDVTPMSNEEVAEEVEVVEVVEVIGGKRKRVRKPMSKPVIVQLDLETEFVATSKMKAQIIEFLLKHSLESNVPLEPQEIAKEFKTSGDWVSSAIRALRAQLKDSPRWEVTKTKLPGNGKQGTRTGYLLREKIS